MRARPEGGGAACAASFVCRFTVVPETGKRARRFLSARGRRQSIHCQRAQFSSFLASTG